VAICPNLTEARGISGEHEPEDCAAWLRDRGVERVAIKMGRDGAYVLDAQSARHMPPKHVRARDETGAGDAFAAGLICGLLKGWPLEQAAALANSVGALSTTGIGASTALPDLEEALAL
jgi:sugar/nucleoside kinase (ribokinase family)